MLGRDLENVRALFVDRYTVEAKLPWNGLTFMYRARRQSKPVVVAVLPVDCGSSLATATTFQEEAERLLELEDPHLVRVLGFGIQQDIPFLELERASGFPMASAPAPGDEARIPGRRAVRIVQQVLRGLEAVHGAGLLHLDVTPANVLIDGDNVRLVGAGIPLMLHAVRDTSATGPTGRGSGPQAGRYLAPEVRIGDRPSESSDVYGAGALLYRFLTGESPPLPGDSVGTVPRRLVPVLAKAMARERQVRFATPLEFREALENVLAEVDEEDLTKAQRHEAAKAETLRPAAPGSSRHNTTLLVGGATVLGAAVIAVGIALGARSPEPPEAAGAASSSEIEARQEPAVEQPPSETPEEGDPATDADGTDADETTVEIDTEAADEGADGDDGTAGVPSDATQRTTGDLLAGELPYPLAALRESLDASELGAGPRLDRSALAPASRWALAHPEDPRGHLMLAEAYMRLGWAQDALDRYMVAYRADPSALEHQTMLTDLLELSRREDTGESAAAAILRTYGPRALPRLEEVLAGGGLRWNEERRLVRLRALLQRSL